MKAHIIKEDPHPEPWEDYSYPIEVILGEKHQAEWRLAELEKLRPDSLFMLYEDIDVLDLKKQN